MASTHRPEFRLIPPIEDKQNKWMRHMPVAYWLPRYNWSEWFAMDLVATVTDLVMVIPQAMGYALVAGLQPIQGLYSALMGHCLYGPFGTSGQLIVAPVAIVSLMTKETLHEFFHDDEHGEDLHTIEQKAAYASAIAFQSGVICILLGLCKAGVLANMLAEPVIVGFTFAAAILIGISQLTFVFQINIHGESVIDKLIAFFTELPHSHLNSVILAICCVIFLLCVKYYGKSNLPGAVKMKFIPTALVLVTITTSISFGVGTSSGFDVVGSLPNGLPQPKNFFSLLNDGDFWHLWMPSALITLLSFIESIAVASKFADKHGYAIDASQELLALGACNLIGCWFQIYPVSGVLSLATVVEAAGATTPLYGMMAGGTLILVCSFALFLFEWLPKPVLGAIVLVGIMGLMDTHKMKKVYQINKRDFGVLCTTIFITLFLGIDFGVMLGVVASIVLFLQKSAKPHYSVLGRMKDNDLPVYRNVKHYPADTTRRSDMLMIRWDAPIFFANVDSFKSRINKQIRRFNEEYNYPRFWCLVIDCSSVNDVDFTAIEMLEGYLEDLKKEHRGMTLLLTKLTTPVERALTNGGIVGGKLIPNDHVLWELHEAETWWDHYLLNLNYGHEQQNYAKVGDEIVFKHIEAITNVNSNSKNGSSRRIGGAGENEQDENENDQSVHGHFINNQAGRNKMSIVEDDDVVEVVQNH
jgi:high affinity sulfate transporter 1